MTFGLRCPDWLGACEVPPGFDPEELLQRLRAEPDLRGQLNRSTRQRIDALRFYQRAVETLVALMPRESMSMAFTVTEISSAVELEPVPTL